MSTPDLLFGQKHYDLAKYKVFLSCLSAIGMLYDYANVFFVSERSMIILAKGYKKLLASHTRGYEEEKKAEKEKFKASPIGRILSGPTGDTAGKNRVSGAGQDDEDGTL
jgi:hypothetical protein